MERRTININQGWRFDKPGEPEIMVNLPHTWNATDGQDGGNDYWRGTCVYQKTFPKPDFGPDERVYLEFQGVNASARVVLNGQEVGAHDGGYSTTSTTSISTISVTNTAWWCGRRSPTSPPT